MLVVLHELMDSDDEKPHRGKTRKWVKRRSERGYFNNIIRELRIEDRAGFRQMFKMDVTDFEFILSQSSNLISPQERFGGTNPNECVERLALTLRYLAKGVSYIVKGCCKAIAERMASVFVKVPSTKARYFKKVLRKMEFSTRSLSHRWETYQNSEAKEWWLLLLQLQTHSFYNFDGYRRSRIQMIVR